jgi:hypothetical protein
MADNVGYTPGAGATIAADDIGGILFQRIKVTWGPDGTANDADTASGKPLPVQLRLSTGEVLGVKEDAASADADSLMPVAAKRQDTPVADSGTDGDYETLRMFAGMLWTWAMSLGGTVQTDITRPADTNAYAANDNFSDSTSAPTSGGFTLTNCVRKSGGSAVLTDMWICSSNPAGGLQGEIWLFETSVTNINDNAAFAISDSEIKTVVAKIPFTLVADTNNAGVHVQNINCFVTASGSRNLRYLVKVKAAYTPISAEVLTVKAKFLWAD